MARQFLVPGWGYVNETLSGQHLLSGQGFLDQRAAIASNSVGTIASATVVAGVGASIAEAAGTVTSVATLTAVADNSVGAGTITCLTAVNGAGAVRARIADYLIPAFGYLHETTPRQYLVPGWGYINETQTTGTSGTITCTSAVAGVGIVGPSSATIEAVSTVSGVGLALTVADATIACTASVVGAGSSRFYSPIAYTNFDDLFNYISLAQTQIVLAAGSATCLAEVAGIGTATAESTGSITSTCSVTGVASPPTLGQLDFSVTVNSGLIAGVM